MIPTAHLLAFAATSFAIIVVPGPSVLFVIGRGVALGRRAALATVVGNAAGVYLQVIAVALGLGELVERSDAVFNVLKLGGAAYLVFLGLRTIRHRRQLSATIEVSAAPRSTARIVREGFFVGMANPKAAVFLAAVLPQFVDRSQGMVPVQLLFLGLVFIAIALVSDGAWGLAAGTARAWFGGSPRRLERIGGAGGLILVGLGINLALTRRSD